MFNFDGHYKVEVHHKAFDKMNRIRPTSVCYAIRMEMARK